MHSGVMKGNGYIVTEDIATVCVSVRGEINFSLLGVIMTAANMVSSTVTNISESTERGNLPAQTVLVHYKVTVCPYELFSLLALFVHTDPVRQAAEMTPSSFLSGAKSDTVNTAVSVYAFQNKPL